jgi:aldose 1-epimerase
MSQSHFFAHLSRLKLINRWPREHGDYSDWQGLALESELLPDSPNHAEWPQPDCVLLPGETYRSLTEYLFIAH